MLLDYTCEFPTMDSYCVTLVSGRKSWGIINRIKCFDSIQSVNAMDLQEFSHIVFNKNAENKITMNWVSNNIFRLYVWIPDDGFLLCHFSLR